MIEISTSGATVNRVSKQIVISLPKWLDVSCDEHVSRSPHEVTSTQNRKPQRTRSLIPIEQILAVRASQFAGEAEPTLPIRLGHQV